MAILLITFTILGFLVRPLMRWIYLRDLRKEREEWEKRLPRARIKL